MNWDIAAVIIFLLCMTAGVTLIKDIRVWSWSLKRRASLRNSATGRFMKYNTWESFLESRKENSVFTIFFRWIRIHREKKMDREIFESITYLRNMASIGKGRTSSTDYIIEQLSEHNGLLKPVFIRMLNLLRVNRPKDAAALFSQKVGTLASRDFAGLLIQWDRLEPGELLETLLSYEKSMKAVRLTDQKRKDEIISDLIYLPVVVNILIIFINFIYVAYFIDQKEILQMFL